MEDCKLRAVTDDGNLSDLREALPTLLAKGLEARFAISVRQIGERGYLDRLDIRELVAAGMTVISHGVDHRRWTELEPTQLIRQALESRLTLEDITGTPIDEAACPFGAYDARVLTTLRQAGYSRIYTSDGGTWNGVDKIVPRTTIRAGDDFDSAMDKARARYSGLRGMLRRVKIGARRWSAA